MNRPERRAMEREAKKVKPVVGKNVDIKDQHLVSLQTPVGQVGAIGEDFQALFQMNPLALEQLKGIILSRVLLAEHSKVAMLEKNQAAKKVDA